MHWISTEKEMPHSEVLIYAEGEYYVAAVVEATTHDPEPSFVSAHSSDLLPWPSHWMALPPAPVD
jgi:hypothetical protein